MDFEEQMFMEQPLIEQKAVELMKAEGGSGSHEVPDLPDPVHPQLGRSHHAEVGGAGRLLLGVLRQGLVGRIRPAGAGCGFPANSSRVLGWRSPEFPSAPGDGICFRSRRGGPRSYPSPSCSGIRFGSTALKCGRESQRRRWISWEDGRRGSRLRMPSKHTSKTSEREKGNARPVCSSLRSWI